MTPTINDGTWHNIAYTRTGTTFSLYLDGVLNQTATSAAPVNVLGAAPFKLGRSLPCLSGFHSIAALSDDVRTYSRALGACDVSALVGGHAGTPATFPPPPPPSCPCAGTAAWTNAISAPAEFCNVVPGFVDFFFGDFGEGTVSDAESGGFCFASDSDGNFVVEFGIAPADADVCIAQVRAVACP